MTKKPSPRRVSDKPVDPVPFDIANFLPYRLLIATQRVTRYYAPRYARELGLTVPESRILVALGSFAPSSSREICERTDLPKSRVSVTIQRLEAAGIVDRAVDASDRRLVELTLTQNGWRLYREMLEKALDIETELIAGIGAEGKATLLRLLELLERSATAERADDDDADRGRPPAKY